MKAVVKARPAYGADFLDMPEPVIKKNELLVKVRATSICGTDVHIYDWNEWAAARVKPPLVMGHEFAGEVVEVGRDVKGFAVGDSVSGETHIPCHRCEQCRTGNEHICENVQLRGVDTQGCFAEFVALDESTAWRNDKSIPYEVASAQEPLGNAVHTVFAGGGVEGKTVAIFGCGPIGILSATLCRQSGAEKVFAVDISDYRLKLAQEFGATSVVNSKLADPVKEIMSQTNGRGVDVFLEMAGVPETIRQGLKVIRSGGRACLLGLPSKPVEIDVSNDIVLKMVELHGIYGRRIFGTWYTVASYLRSGKVDLARLITHRYRMSEYQEAFNLMKSGQSGKIVMTP
ncbi:MAG TPA: L-threonine 3-dehydrogenase [Conexivisphaerales archaeon]|nr:L-threonine 3-dehydrogenase [Conexivisphaerales archaeon]